MNDFVWGLKNGDLDQVMEAVEKVRIAPNFPGLTKAVTPFPQSLIIRITVHTKLGILCSWYCDGDGNYEG